MIKITTKAPNHICKNEQCKKEYYACNYCDRISNYKAYCCSSACYDAYTEQILNSRSKATSIDLLPDRIDMTAEEVKSLLETPVEKVLADTQEDLKEYLDNGMNYKEAVDEINKGIDAEAKTQIKINTETKNAKTKKQK